MSTVSMSAVVRDIRGHFCKEPTRSRSTADEDVDSVVDVDGEEDFGGAANRWKNWLWRAKLSFSDLEGVSRAF